MPKIPQLLHVVLGALAMTLSQRTSASVIFDDMDNVGNFSVLTDLTIINNVSTAVFEPSEASVESASVIWSNGGSDFALAPGQVLSFFFTAYQGGTASSFTTLDFTAVYNDAPLTEILLGSGNLLLFVANGETGNFPIPEVAGATGWSLRMDFAILTSAPSGSLGTVDLDYLQVVPEPSSALLATASLAGVLLRRRRN